MPKATRSLFFHFVVIKKRPPRLGRRELGTRVCNVGRRVVWKLVEVGEFVLRAEYFNNLVLVEFLHVVASGTEILARVKFTGFFSEGLTDGSGHSQARVRVDVDFANCAGSSLAELLFGNSDCVGEAFVYSSVYSSCIVYALTIHTTRV